MWEGRSHVARALASYYHFSRRTGPLCVHDDGTMRMTECAIVRKPLPNARMIPCSWADAVMEAELRNTPCCAMFRKNHVSAKKLFSVAMLARSERILYMN